MAQTPFDDIDLWRYDGRMPIDRKRLVPGSLPACKLLASILDKAERAGVSVNELERTVDAGNGALRRMAQGERGPSVALALRMRDILGIPVEAWDGDYKKARKAEFL